MNAFAPDYSKAIVAASRLFALFDQKSAIYPLDEGGVKLVRYFITTSEVNLRLKVTIQLLNMSNSTAFIVSYMISFLAIKVL